MVFDHLLPIFFYPRTKTSFIPEPSLIKVSIN